VAGLQNAYYKLKQTDLTGESKYICTVLHVRFSEHNAFIIGKIYPNPTTSNEIFVNITTAERRKIRIEFMSATGQLISWQEKEVLPGTSRVSLNTGMMTQGSYQVRFMDQDNKVSNVQSLIRY
jgi:hypothetical protein